MIEYIILCFMAGYGVAFGVDGLGVYEDFAFNLFFSVASLCIYCITIILYIGGYYV